MKTEAEKKLEEFDAKYDAWFKHFNDLHRRAKRIKQMMARMRPVRDKLIKDIQIDKAAGEGLGPLAD